MEKMGGAGLQEGHRRSPISHAKCLPFDHQSILMKDHFMGTEKLCKIPIF